MRRWSFWNVVPPGPLLSLLLIGLVLLSGLLYYRAVRIQRFMEPALALSQPRNDFSEAIEQNLRVMDQTAFALCREARIPIRVFDMQPEGAIAAALLGEPLGSLVIPD